MLAFAPAAHAATFAGFEITFTAPDSRQWNINPNGAPVETLSALAPNTSPAIAGLTDGGYEESFVASDDTLWIANSVTGGQQLSRAAAPTASHRTPARPSPPSPAAAGTSWRVQLVHWYEQHRS
jgi:hypothetical protein